MTMAIINMVNDCRLVVAVMGLCSDLPCLWWMVNGYGY